MLQKRAQGRPGRGSEEVGPSRIIEGARTAIRACRSGNVTRKDIAHYAGVTPALVTYYFKVHRDLIAAATVPLIESYAAELKAIIESDRSYEERLQDSIVLLLRSHRVDKRIIETYRNVVAPMHGDGGKNLLAIMATDLEMFFTEWLDSIGSHASPRFLADVAWGICNQMANQPSERAIPGSSSEDDRMCHESWSMIFSLFASAPASLPPSSKQEGCIEAERDTRWDVDVSNNLRPAQSDGRPPSRVQSNLGARGGSPQSCGGIL